VISQVATGIGASRLVGLDEGDGYVDVDECGGKEATSTVRIDDRPVLSRERFVASRLVHRCDDQLGRLR
jgi:hypothetical protein